MAIFTHEFTVKFGIDFKDLKINAKPYSDTIFISGIKPRFIGMANFKSNEELAEIRRVTVSNVDKKGEVKTYEILDGKGDRTRAANFSKEYRKKYEERLNKGLQTKFMDAAVVKLAKNFIKLILAPLGKKIEFVDRPAPNSVSLEKYLQNNLKEVEERLKTLKNSNSQTTKELETQKQLLEEANKKLQKAKAELNKQERDNFTE